MKLPVWLWLIFVLFGAIGGIAGGLGGASDSASDNGTQPEAEQATTSEALKLRYKPAKDPIENLLAIANASRPELPAWQWLGRTFTDDDMVYDDIRIDVNNDVDYQAFDATAELIEVALLIARQAQSPVQIDLRIKVEHTEAQPDGTVTKKLISREWIEITGEGDQPAATVDVYGHEPAETAKMNQLAEQLQKRFPGVIVKTTDTSSFDD